MRDGADVALPAREEGLGWIVPRDARAVHVPTAAAAAPSEDARRRRLGTHDGAAGGARGDARRRGGGYVDLLIFKYLFERGSSETLG